MSSLPARAGKVAAWLVANGRSTFRSWAFYVAVGSAVVTGIAAIDEDVRNNGVTILLPEVGVGVALSAVVLAAIAIFTTFFDDWYRRVLETASGSVRAALLPYRVVAVIAGWATLLGLVVAVTWPVLPAAAQAILLALATGLTVWAIAASVQLVELTMWHADQRAKLMRGVEDARLRVARMQQGKSA